VRKTIILGAVALACVAGTANAAPPARNGAFGGFYLGHASFDFTRAQADGMAQSVLADLGTDFTNYESDFSDTDIGYQFEFGYRFLNYLAITVGVVEFGAVEVSATADLTRNGNTVPAKTNLRFTGNGPLFSVLGILPVTKELEFFGRAGLLLTSPRIDLRATVDGERYLGAEKGESRELVYGIGASWNVSQRWSARLEYQVVKDLGEANKTGEYDLTVINLGAVARF
jgi:opacity protein-like surface antigen